MNGSRFLARLRPGLLAKIIFSLALTGLIPVVFVSYRLVDLNRDALTDQVLHTHAVAARTAAERIDAFISAWDSLALTLAENPQINEDPKSPESGLFISDLLSARPDLLAFSITTLEGEEVLRAQRREFANEISTILYSQRGEAIRIVDGLPPRVVLTVPLSGGGGRLHLVADAAELRASLDPEELGAEADLAILAADRTVVLGSPLTRFPPKLIDEALSGRIKGSGRYIDDSSNLVLGAYSPVLATDWTVVSRQPAEVAEAISLALRRRAIIAVAVAVVLIGIVTTIAYLSFVRPLRRLLRAQRSLENLPVSGEGSEIDQLKQSLDLLEKRSKDRNAIGEVFVGRYLVLDVLGQGGMGTVFRGWDPKLMRNVALKTLRRGVEQQGDLKEQARTLLQEAITVARFNHPNIVGIYDIQDSPSAACLAMEYIEGMSLESSLWHHDSFPQSRATVLVLAVAKALSIAHKEGIVHRDIKPANILLSRSDEIKVTDFGIAGFLSTVNKSDGKIFGTPGYIPPELLLQEKFGPEGDLFSLGVIFYECLTGKNPFARANLRETLTATVKFTPDAPSVLRPGIDSRIDRIVLRLIAKKTKQRYSDSNSLVGDLEAIANEFHWKWQYPTTGSTQSLPLAMSLKASFFPTLRVANKD